MNRKEKFVLAKNATANIVRGGAAAMVALALPPFLTRMMSADSFGAWSLVLQVSAYVGYLDFGIQTAVGRFVAHSNEKGDAEHRDRIVSTALAALTVAGAAALAGALGLAVLLPRIFRHVPSIMFGDMRVALLLVAGSLAIGLPASVFNGVFVGLQRYEVPAAIIGGSRIFSAVALILVVRHGSDLTHMAIAVAAVNVASYALQYLMYRKMVPDGRFSVHSLSRKTGKELFDYCLSLSIWSVAMLLVSGMDLSLVGYFQFEAVAYYAVATSLITFVAGLQNALFNVMVPSTAVLHARGQSRELGRLMISATRYGTLLLLLTGVPLILTARGVLTLWVGPVYAAHGVAILQILVAANIIRLSAVPYVMTLIGTGEQRLVTVTPFLEGVTNLVVSIIAGSMFGAVGVAIGTLLGSFVGVGGNVFYNMHRTAHIAFRVSDYLRDGLVRPAICALPLIVYVAAIEVNKVPATTIRFLCLVATILATGILVWRFGLLDSEREKLRAWRLAPQL